MSSATAVSARPRRSALAIVWAFLRRHVLTAYSILFFVYLMLPIAVVVVFSFNNPVGRFNYTWQGFTWDNWRYWDGVPGIRGAIILSLEIALIASLVATALGTLIALALVRYGFRARGATNILIFLPLSTPEIVLGASLLTLFLNLNVVFGFWTILIAHIMFCISFAVVTVKARLIGFDRHLEEAAMDLGRERVDDVPQGDAAAYRARPILASLLLCFAISIDDFVVTYFNSGSEVTFPLFVWGAARIGAPPQVNVIGTAIFVVATSCDAVQRPDPEPAREERMTTVQTTLLPRRAAAGAARDHLWLHFTRMGGYREGELPVIVRGDGCYLEDVNGKRYLDALAGLFAVQIGYSYGDEIGEAAAAQMRELPFYTNWSYAHPRAIELAAEVA